MTFPRFLAVALVAMPAAVPAQTPPPDITILPPVGVTATRTEKPVDQVPATVSIIDDRQLEQQQAVRPSDVVRYEPGVTVGNQPARGGQTNYVIRGIGDNRVLILQDGLRVQDFPSTNVGAGTYTRNYIDLDTVKRVEIVRGPASALYGSDALGGVVNHILKDPSDYLDLTGKNIFLSGKLGYNGADNSLYETITGAARVGKTEFMLLYTRRDGHETQANGSISANPQTYFGNSVLGRIVLHATDVDTIRITAQYNELITSTRVRSEETTTPPAGFTPGTKVFSSRGLDTNRRGGVTLDWTHDAPLLFVDTLRVSLSGSYLQRREQTDQFRASFPAAPVPATPNRRRVSDFFFDQAMWMADLQATTKRDPWGAPNLFTYGVSGDLTYTTRPRDRYETNLTTGVSTATVAGETFPNKNFPDTTTTRAGVYLQDEITLGRLELTPALRIDMYNLTPHPDGAFNKSSGGALTVHSANEVSISPKFGALLHLTEQYSVYGQYAHGYRPPPYDSTNFGFTNAAFGYQILPNGNLKSETSDGVELGFRGKFDRGSFQVNAFYNQSSNFIDTRVVGSAGGLMQFKYVNVPDVRIWGTEARAEYRPIPSVTLRGALAWARGEDSQTGNPVDSVDPVKLVTGVSWRHESGFGVDANLTHAWRHDRVSDATFFKAPSYTTLDLLAHYDLNQSVTINGGIFNITNAKYFVSQDVNGVAATNPIRDLYMQPGRYVALNATVRW